MGSPSILTIDGVAWHSPPPCAIQTTAAFIKDRPIVVQSTGDWSVYRNVDFYFRPAPSEGLGDGGWCRTDVSTVLYDHPDLVHLGRVPVSPHGAFTWTGQYPGYVRSHRFYLVLAVADDGLYAVWGQPFGWSRGPRNGLPGRPDRVARAPHGTLVARKAIQPGRHRRRVLMERFKTHGDLRVGIPAIEQYSNCSVVVVHLEGPIGRYDRLVMRLTIAGYQCHFDRAPGDRAAADHVFVVTPPIPDEKVATLAFAVELQSQPWRRGGPERVPVAPMTLILEP